MRGGGVRGRSGTVERGQHVLHEQLSASTVSFEAPVLEVPKPRGRKKVSTRLPSLPAVADK